MNGLEEYFTSVQDVASVVGELVGVFLVGIGIGVWGHIQKNKTLMMWSKKKEQRFVESHSQAHELLTELRITIRASRCLVFQFHNGGSFADGTSIKRFSITHESCGVPAQSMILESHDVLLTRYIDIVPLMETRAGEIIDVDTLSPSAFRSGLEINRVKYFSIIPLKCVDGLTPLGFLCCHWCSVEPIEEIEKEGVSPSKLQDLILDGSQNINAYLAYKTRKQ